MRLDLIDRLSKHLERIGAQVTRYGLVIVLLWIGGMKFTAYEAEGIRPLVSHSPFMGWIYHFLSVQAFSSLLGAVEIAVGILIALRPVWPAASAAASGFTTVLFLSTLSFLFTTPGWEPSLGGFPALSFIPGEFVIKDAVLLGASLWTAGEALAAVRPARVVASATL